MTKQQQPECQNCDSQGWVCENHPNLPWGGVSEAENACDCGAGVPCRECNPCGGRDDPPRDPPGMKVSCDTKYGFRH